MNEDKMKQAERVFLQRGGVLKTSDALDAGIHPRTLYALRDNGVITALSWGIYCLTGRDDVVQPDLVSIALRVPRGVVCLISALSYHNITTEIPHELSVAIPRGVTPAQIGYPPVRFFLYGKEVYDAGIETHEINKVSVRVYSPEKTVADCFRFRNKIGLDVAIEALKLVRKRKKSSPRQLLHYARICRVDRVMKPYLEALLP
jgi:predicted transcriptional regulator of viral defense system